MSNMKKRREGNKHDLCFHSKLFGTLHTHQAGLCTEFLLQDFLLMRGACQMPCKPRLPSRRITSRCQGVQLIFLALRLHHKNAAVPAQHEIPWRVSHPSNIHTKCCLTSVFEWELVYPTW
jgi:hypothetical protein